MKKASWGTVASLFAQVVVLPVSERLAFIDGACAGDDALRAELDSLLEHYDRASDFFDRLAFGAQGPLGEGEAAGSALPEPLAPGGDPHHLIGQTLSHYRVLEPLGRGGMGLLYRAEDTRLHRPVALKLLPPHLAHDHRARQRFLLEARAAAALDHVHLCTLYDVGETDDGRGFIAMALYEGQTLRELIRRGPLPLPRALATALAMARGLAHAHAHGIVHRDVKPANVFITDDGVVKLLDFGLAKHEDITLTRTGVKMGTVAYMSPEQARGEPVDAGTDVWSLGVVLFEMLTGFRPYQGDYAQAVLYAIQHEAVPPILLPSGAEAPAGVEAVVKLCLEKDRALRYPAMDDVVADLEALQHSERTASLTATGSTAGSSAALPTSSRSNSLDARPERRQVSFLFIDFMARSGAADPDALHEAVPAYRDACLRVLGRFDGHVLPFSGDGMLVAFGYPHAHEDDAYRAVSAGLRLAETIQRMGANETTEAPITARLAVHTGNVVIEALGPHPQITGRAPEIAMRLQDDGAAGTLVVSAATHRLVEGFFACRPQEPRAVRGLPDALPVYQVLHESGARSRLEAAPQGLSPLVGRDLEAGLLRSRWAQAAEGRGQVVLLSGEAGLGKSRLVRALEEEVAADSQAWLAGCRCSPYHQNTALYPLIDFFRREVLGGVDAPAASQLAQLEGLLTQYGIALGEGMPLLGKLMALPVEDRYPEPVLSPEAQKRKLLQMLLQILLQRATVQPVLFVLEDLHWADPTSLELLGMIIEHAPAASVLALVTYRTEFQPPWPPRAHVAPLSLARLTPDAAAALVHVVTGENPLPEAVRREIVEKCDGVPLFIEEVTKAVLESRRHADAPEAAPPASTLSDLDVPATLKASLAARLDRLGEARAVAQLAAVLGRDFSLDLLRAV
ncbi:MAG: protein kinase, partial [Rhodothermales bacterium]|nr:protein kinase [Rhodothermales bacterium]